MEVQVFQMDLNTDTQPLAILDTFVPVKTWRHHIVASVVFGRG